MASNLEKNGQPSRNSYLAPISAVKEFFECLTELKGLSRGQGQNQADK